MHFSDVIFWTWWRCLCLDKMTCALGGGACSPSDCKSWQDDDDDFRCIYLRSRHLSGGIPSNVPECWASPEVNLQEPHSFLFHTQIVNVVGLSWPLDPLFRETPMQLWDLWHGAGLEHIGTIFIFIKDIDSCLKAQRSYLPESSSVLLYEHLHEWDLLKRKLLEDWDTVCRNITGKRYQILAMSGQILLLFKDGVYSCSEK